MLNRFLMIVGVSVLGAWTAARGADFVVYEGKSGMGAGKAIVFLTGDEEYRGEESMPQLAKILAERHGFKCTVLFAIDPADGTINPKVTTSLPGAEAIDSADVIVMALRFRNWPDEVMKHFVDAYLAGKPIVALRTSTHAFKYDAGSPSAYAKFSWDSKVWPGGFGKQVLGETWVAHHGAHKKEATRGVIEASAKGDELLRGVTDVFGNTDVYAANPPSDAKILVRGQVLTGMNASDGPVAGAKNDPMQPVVWTRLFKNEAGRTNKVFCTTMGAATDFQSVGLRRLVVNAVYWGAGLDVPEKADVSVVGDYKPSMYGFDGFIKGVKPADLALRAKPSAQLDLKAGDHVALIGNTLPDRFQHSGWLETMIYAAHPDLDLVFRNLAVAGDEVATRHRPADFGSADEWLKKTQADVVFAFFGFNESFQGKAGVDKFKADLDAFLKETAAKNYSGRKNARVVLFSPIANERHSDGNFADPSANNANIRLYVEAMRQVADADCVRFVDLFEPSLRLYDEAAKRGESLTINGMHLSDKGDRLLAEVICKALIGENVPPAPNEKLRAAVNDKNAQWESRYRTVDGNNVYGGRSALAYQPGKGGFITDRNPAEPYISNYKILQEEMTQRDVMTANRDKRIWAVAKGGDLAVDDSNLPPVDKIKSNHPGPNADESFKFLGAQEAISKMKVHSGMKVNVFASEEQFPELAKPVQMAWDTKGRLWIAVWPNYPERTPDSKVGDSLIILEDTNGDGKADKCTHFIDDLNAPTGFQFYKDGVLVMEAPDLWFARDSNKDGKADSMERVLMGMSSADSHHTANSICLDPGGAVYLSDGVFHRTQVETATGPVRNNDAAIFRYEPRTAKFETYVAYNFANPHGRAFDYWGNDLITDGTGNNTYFGPAFSGHIDYPAKHDKLNEFWARPSRPCAGTAILTSRHFPAEFQGNFLNCNVISFQGIYRVKVTEDGSGLKGERMEDLISSADPNFRPVAVNVGPDGAIYLADWQNPIIGHMQHHLRDPNRDHDHGRIYRITYEGRPLMKPAKVDGEPILALLKLLKEPENLTRELAKIELGKRNTADVIAAVKKWSAALDAKDASYEHHMSEALWVHQWHNVVDAELLKRMLHSPDAHARAAAGRVLCYWRDRVPDALALFKALADDENPRVRLEAVRAASFFRNAEAADAALTALKHPTDYYLDYVLGETMQQLKPWWRKALASGESLAGDNPAGRDFLLHTIQTPELLKMPRSEMLLQTIITRNDATDADRMVALGDLAKLRGTNLVAVLVSEMDRDKGASKERSSRLSSLTALARLVPYQKPEDLKPVRDQMERAAIRGEPTQLRPYAWAGLVLADGSFEQAWSEAAKSPTSLADLVKGIPLLPDPDFRAKAYEKVKALVEVKVQGSDLRQAAIRALTSMNHEQEQVFRILADLIVRGQDLSSAAEGLRMIPRSKWPRDQAAKAAIAIVGWSKSIPASARTSEEYYQTVQLAEDLAGMLPPEQAASVRKELRDLRVSVFVIRAVREQMRYDTPRLVIEPAKPFEIIFENSDFMPHNVVVVKPDTREKIGLQSANMKPEEIDSEGRAYVPKSSDILAATKLLLPGQRQSLKLTAPSTEGTCEYVCTFPGHYQVMWGQLVVTKDVEAYLQAHPEAPLPAPSATALSEPGAHDHPHSH